MSSRKRRQAREWMHQEYARHEEQLRRERAHSETRAREAAAEERRKYELVVPPPDNGDAVYYPAGRIQQTHLVIPLRPGIVPFSALDPRDDMQLRTMMMHERSQLVHLYAKQRAMRLPDGASIVWWDWEARP